MTLEDELTKVTCERDTARVMLARVTKDYNRQYKSAAYWCTAFWMAFAYGVGTTIALAVKWVRCSG